MDQSHRQVCLRWAARSDIPDIARVLHANFLGFEFFDHVCPARRERSAEFYEFVRMRVRMFFNRAGLRFMVAERRTLTVAGQSTEILGFAAWEATGPANPVAAEWKRQDCGWLETLERTLTDAEIWYYRHLRDTIVDYRGLAALRSALLDSYADVDALRSHIHLQLLMVAPDCQGLGIGDKLIRWGLDVADQTKLPVVLESSLRGHQFYAHRGFKVLTHVRIDRVPKFAYDMPIMFYEPGSQATSGAEGLLGLQ